MTPPIITVQAETQTLPVANTIRFKCGVRGNPAPNITWYHNGQVLSIHGKFDLFMN